MEYNENNEIENELKEIKRFKKKNLIEIIWYMNPINTDLIFEVFPQQDHFVTVFSMIKL